MDTHSWLTKKSEITQEKQKLQNLPNNLSQNSLLYCKCGETFVITLDITTVMKCSLDTSDIRNRLHPEILCLFCLSLHVH
jgi:5-methylcytosine-specific restriction endonuclease McrA